PDARECRRGHPHRAATLRSGCVLGRREGTRRQGQEADRGVHPKRARGSIRIGRRPSFGRGVDIAETLAFPSVGLTTLERPSKLGLPPMDGINSLRNGPDEHGRFGIYGGRFVAETLMPLILDLERHYREAKADPAYLDELKDLAIHYTGRPSPL